MLPRKAKPNGQLVIIAGMYFGSKFDKRNLLLTRVGGMRRFSVQKFESTLQNAGFHNVTVVVEPLKGWSCVIPFGDHFITLVELNKEEKRVVSNE